MLAGLARPTGGTAAVLGGAPRQDPAFLAEIGYLAQEIPLYRRLSAEDHIRAGAHLNPRWDGAACAGPAERPSDTARPGGGHAVGRAAGPGRAHPRARQAAPGAAARRAGGRARPAGQAAVPRHLDGGRRRRRGRPHRAAVLACHRRRGTGLRPHGPGDRVPGAAVRGHRRVAGRRTSCSSARARTRPSWNARTRLCRQHGRTGNRRCWSGSAGRFSTPLTRSATSSLEDLVLGYLGADAAPGHAHLTTVGEDS